MYTALSSMDCRVTHLRLVAKHDVVLHGMRDVVDCENQTGAIFDASKAGSSPGHHEAGSVLSVQSRHIGLKNTENQLLLMDTVSVVYSELHFPQADTVIYGLVLRGEMFFHKVSCCSYIYRVIEIVKQTVTNRRNKKGWMI